MASRFEFPRLHSTRSSPAAWRNAQQAVILLDAGNACVYSRNAIVDPNAGRVWPAFRGAIGLCSRSPEQFYSPAYAKSLISPELRSKLALGAKKQKGAPESALSNWEVEDSSAEATANLISTFRLEQ